MEDKIDIVIAWVDGNDPLWQAEFNIYAPKITEQDDASTVRYRDWDNLQYVFRGIESFAPWVDKIYFLTWGHTPKWLNTQHPKLKIVNHKDYMPAEYLPTFSSIPIELNMHRIEGLSEKFIYFNDDMFLISPISPSRFFRKDLPCDIARLSINPDANDAFINKRYSKRKAIKSNFFKWFNYRYKLDDLLKTLSLVGWSEFYGFKLPHVPQAFLKSNFEKLWDQEYETLHLSSSHKFRHRDDVSQWCVRAEQLASGGFAPHGNYDSLYRAACEEDIDELCDYIKAQKGNMVCVCDNDHIRSFETMKDRVIEAFDFILPNKSGYEL